jgi:hypothetical protein
MTQPIPSSGRIRSRIYKAEVAAYRLRPITAPGTITSRTTRGVSIRANGSRPQIVTQRPMSQPRNWLYV